jgi:hypothetical protein
MVSKETMSLELNATLYERKDSFADVIKLKSLNWGDYSGLLR